MSNMSFRVTQQSEERMGKSFMQNKRGSHSNTRVDGIIPMSSDRIKALEAAYLTKLARPNRNTTKKTTPKGKTQDYEEIVSKLR